MDKQKRTMVLAGGAAVVVLILGGLWVMVPSESANQGSNTTSTFLAADSQFTEDLDSTEPITRSTPKASTQAKRLESPSEEITHESTVATGEVKKKAPRKKPRKPRRRGRRTQEEEKPQQKKAQKKPPLGV